MRELSNKLALSVPIEQAFEWFINLDKNYIDWHPLLHIKCQWISGKPIGKNSIFIIEEKDKKGNKHKGTFIVTEYLENKRLCFLSREIRNEIKYMPSCFVNLLVWVFRIKMKMERDFISNSSFSTTIHTKHILGSEIPIIGKLVNYLIDRFLFSKKEHTIHMEEENEYMKRKLEE